jgi:hypothetical protein
MFSPLSRPGIFDAAARLIVMTPEQRVAYQANLLQGLLFFSYDDEGVAMKN